MGNKLTKNRSRTSAELRDFAITSSFTLFFALSFSASAVLTVSAQRAQNSPKCATNGLVETEITAIVNDHNVRRSQVNAPKLVWDCMLANMAQAWAEKGVFGHSGTELGENIFVSATANTTPAAALIKWMGEEPGWDNKSGKCQTGKICTHYTQIVWKTTAKIGCGINRNATGKWKTIVACNYSPAGNMPGPAF